MTSQLSKLSALATLQRISDAIDPDGGPLEPEHYDALASKVDAVLAAARGLTTVDPDDGLPSMLIDYEAYQALLTALAALDGDR